MEVLVRGKKYNDDIKEKALAMLMTNNNTSEIARILNINESTLRTWKNEKNNDEFTKLRQEKKKEFVEQAWRIVALGQEMLLNELKNAKENKTDIDIGKLSTVIGTMYDKQALASNEATNRVDGTLRLEDLIKKVEDESDY